MKNRKIQPRGKGKGTVEAPINLGSSSELSEGSGSEVSDYYIDNPGQLTFGCKMCNSYANCTHQARRPEPLTVEENDMRIESEFCQFSLNNPEAEREQMRIEEKWKEEKDDGPIQLNLFMPSSPFCCCKLVFNERMSSPNLPDVKHEPTKAFVDAVNAREVAYMIGLMTHEDLQAVGNVIKVNAVIGGEEKGSWIFCPVIGEDGDDKYYCIHHKPAMKFEKLGERSYYTYCCSDHKKAFRIGYFAKKWSRNKRWAHFGGGRWKEEELDRIMQIPACPREDFGQLWM